MSQLPKHLYERDGIPIRKDGPEGCLHCPMPAGHSVHELEPTPEDAKRVENRMLGERT